jgi:hypothetical protein
MRNNNTTEDNMSKRYYNSNIDVNVTIKANGEFSILGNRHDEVTDEDLWDMAEGITPAGWGVVA